MSSFSINGVVPIIPTAFTEDEGIDYEGLRKLLAFAKGIGVCAVCLPAYASEFYKMSDIERHEIVIEASRSLGSGLPLIAQVNHVSSSYVASAARELEAAGASAISVAVPRMFGLHEMDLLRYFDRILNAITIPLLIQDFNPGGVSVSVSFIKSLRRQYPHFKYLKLEEPLMASKVKQIVNDTHGEVGVIDGWGGMYMLELMDAGICGVMPGLGVADLLQQVWTLFRSGDKVAAYEVFSGVLPQIVYSLQSLEFFHHAEKSLLAARGVLPSIAVREATVTVDDIDREHLIFLNRQIVNLAGARIATAVAPVA